MCKNVILDKTYTDHIESRLNKILRINNQYFDLWSKDEKGLSTEQMKQYKMWLFLSVCELSTDVKSKLFQYRLIYPSKYAYIIKLITRVKTFCNSSSIDNNPFEMMNTYVRVIKHIVNHPEKELYTILKKYKLILET